MNLALALAATLAFCTSEEPPLVWWEAEQFEESNLTARHAFSPENEEQASKLSGGAWIGIAGDHGQRRFARYRVEVPQTGTYSFWCRKFWRHGPFRWRFDRQPWSRLDSTHALADTVELRQHVCANWVSLGEVELTQGRRQLTVELLELDGAAALDCFVLTGGSFTPRGPLRPGEKWGRAPEGWFPFEPDAGDPADSPVDLRRLNHQRAGDHGFLEARGNEFVFPKEGASTRFWAVNASPRIDDHASADLLARRLARLGVNMVRIHGPVFDPESPDPTRLDRRHLEQVHYFVFAMAREGIYTKLSFYFPLWFEGGTDRGLPEYDDHDEKHTFAILFFHPRMQEIHRAWARGLLTTKNPFTGTSLAEDPAVAMVEIVNEDNLFFWTFNPYEVIPAGCMEILEREFGTWLRRKYGSLEKARKKWGKGPEVRGDQFTKGRVGLQSAWHMTADARPEHSQRARDQARFLAELQRRYFEETVEYLRKDLGVLCLISAGNWKTADDRITGPLDRWTYMAGDVIDRHAYFGGRAKGDGSSYSVRVGHTYQDRTAMFDPSTQPARELQYEGMPHIVSEYGYPMPNRFRAESPVITAAYGALQGTDAYFHFAVSTADWEQQHSKFSIYTPVTLGQFPATALMFREGYVEQAPVVVEQSLRLDDLFDLKGTPLPQPQDLDAMRTKRVPSGGRFQSDEPGAIDPLAYFVGRVTAKIERRPGRSMVRDLSTFIDRERRVVRSATGQLRWDFGKGVLSIDAPCAQGATGFLGGRIELTDLTVETAMEYGSILAVSLDGEPLARASEILLQVMTEEMNFGFVASGAKEKRIESLGAPPIVVRDIEGTVTLRKPARVTLLDFDLAERESLGELEQIDLARDGLYYLIERP